MPGLVDLTGWRPPGSRLVVLERAAGSTLGAGQNWLCRCDCGAEAVVPTSRLRRGKTRSCGCLADETRRVHAATARAASPYPSDASKVARDDAIRAAYAAGGVSYATLARRYGISRQRVQLIVKGQ